MHTVSVRPDRDSEPTRSSKPQPKVSFALMRRRTGPTGRLDGRSGTRRGGCELLPFHFIPTLPTIRLIAQGRQVPTGQAT